MEENIYENKKKEIKNIEHIFRKLVYEFYSNIYVIDILFINEIKYFYL